MCIICMYVSLLESNPILQLVQILILLHAATVDSAACLDICASDTDILLQLVHRYANIPNDTHFLGKLITSSVRELYNSYNYL